jgi:hypothetical protein
VTEFEATAIGTANNNYVTASISGYSTVGRLRFDMVTVSGEALAPTLNSPTYAANGDFRFDLAGASGVSYAVQASTNLTDWVSLGTNVPPFQFTDARAGILLNRSTALCICLSGRNKESSPCTTNDTANRCSSHSRIGSNPCAYRLQRNSIVQVTRTARAGLMNARASPSVVRH